jgi:hypothetical protein
MAGIVEHRSATTHIAGGAQKPTEMGTSLGLHGEEGVERHHAIHPLGGDMEMPGDDMLRLQGQIAQTVLRVFEDIDQFAFLIVVSRADGVNLGHRLAG